jgi:hypothetical protein
MKVFISWSGDRSKALAVALKDWIPLILQYAKPWVSEKDISAGERWARAISGELESSNFGILCITPENLSSEWILFEAGALSKSMLDAKVIPLLFGLELSDLRGPLSQFQALKIDQQGVMDVIKAIDSVSETKAADGAIVQLVPALWPQLREKINSIPGRAPAGKHPRPQGEILEELVSQVRGLATRMRDVDPELGYRDLKYPTRAFRDLDPRAIHHLMRGMIDSRDGGLSLLILSGLVRESMPWLAEVLVETHRELKSASPKEAIEIIGRVGRVIEHVIAGRFGDQLVERTKAGEMLMMELPRFLELAVLSRVGFRATKGDDRAGGSADQKT